MENKDRYFRIKEGAELEGRHRIGDVCRLVSLDTYNNLYQLGDGGYGWWYTSAEIEEVFEFESGEVVESVELLVTNKLSHLRAYIEGMYEAYGGTDEGADVSPENQMLKKVLDKIDNLGK